MFLPPTVEDVVTLYYDQRQFRTEIIENTRKTMEEILKRVEAIERRRNIELIDTSDDDDDEDEAAKGAVGSECSVMPVLEDDHYDLEARDFALWLRSISQCLSNKISEDVVKLPDTMEEEIEEDEFEDENERCLHVVRSVFDEETATEVIKNYLWLLRGAVLPERARIIFKKCFLESDSGISSNYVSSCVLYSPNLLRGIYTLQSYINCYMLSRNKKLLGKQRIIFLMMKLKKIKHIFEALFSW